MVNAGPKMFMISEWDWVPADAGTFGLVSKI